MKPLFKILFLCIASVNLGISSNLIPLGILFAFGFVWLYLRNLLYPSVPKPVYRKWVAYGCFALCSLWWVLTPSVEYGVSPWLVFVPAWYLLFLAFWQQRSLGRGAYEVFVAFNGLAALSCSLYGSSRAGMVAGLVGIFFALMGYGRKGGAWYKSLGFLLVFFALGFLSYGGWAYYKQHGYYNHGMSRDYYVKERLMGFEPTTYLGSFSSNYLSRYNNQMVLRVWDSLPPKYLKACSYDWYGSGIWKPSPKITDKVYPARYLVDYAVFEAPLFEMEDSITIKPKTKRVWVQSKLDNMGFFFAEPGAVGVGVKDVDSVSVSLDWNFINENHGKSGNGDWYYFMAPGVTLPPPSLADTNLLQISPKIHDFVASVSDSVLRGDTLASEEILDRIANYFATHFTYSLIMEKTKVEPLFQFWESKSGFCEYYATLAALILRHRHIPCRYVKGFARPETLGGASYALFRRSHAHAWLEAYINGNWVIYDPTPPTFIQHVPAPNYFVQKWELLQGYFSHLFHVVKEGEWRHSADSFQNYVQSFFEGWVFRSGLILLALVLILYKLSRHFKVAKKGNSPQKEKWAMLLNKAERQLRALGYTREAGETVGHFMRRLEKLQISNTKSTGKNSDLIKKQAVLNDLLHILADYENNRWRII
ncbi:MAG: transglutaminase domain-containing protein [Fibrobacteraceae bacterium]|nr:transglutaminase domain-containing protein [Fibrobacteraceae bacterium]